MFPERGPSTATNPPSLRDPKPLSCPAADRWAPQTPTSLKRCDNLPPPCRAASTRSTTITSLDLGQGRLTASKRWPARYIPTPSQNDHDRIRGYCFAGATKSSHAPEDSG